MFSIDAEELLDDDLTTENDFNGTEKVRCILGEVTTAPSEYDGVTRHAMALTTAASNVAGLMPDQAVTLNGVTWKIENMTVGLLGELYLSRRAT